jgi:pSer/pThr/pTyr-binding forkhead associated (FHA) protein
MATLQRLGDEALCPINLLQMKIGRAPDNEIIIEDDAVSGHHALIKVEPAQEQDGASQYMIEDLDSTNHTYVNNKEIKRHILVDGDIIRVGTTRLKFSTQDYTPPQEEFQKTRKLTGGKISSFLFSK